MRNAAIHIAPAILICALLPLGLGAHPMGNFSVNHYSRLNFGTRGAQVTYVLDLAEIPAFQLLGQWQIDWKDQARLVEKSRAQANEWLGNIVVTQAGRRVPLRVVSVTRDLSFSDVVVVGAQMLMTAIFFDTKISRGDSSEGALKSLRTHPETYQPRIVSAIETAAVSTPELAVRAVSARDLKPGMVVREDIRTKNGMFLLAKGQMISDALLARLKNFGGTAGLIEPLMVLAPVIPTAAVEPFCRETAVRSR